MIGVPNIDVTNLKKSLGNAEETSFCDSLGSSLDKEQEPVREKPLLKTKRKPKETTVDPTSPKEKLATTPTSPVPKSDVLYISGTVDSLESPLHLSINTEQKGNSIKEDDIKKLSPKSLLNASNGKKR